MYQELKMYAIHDIDDIIKANKNDYYILISVGSENVFYRKNDSPEGRKMSTKTFKKLLTHKSIVIEHFWDIVLDNGTEFYCNCVSCVQKFGKRTSYLKK